jgi:hypothetical protein
MIPPRTRWKDLARRREGARPPAPGGPATAPPLPDFTRFGPVERKPMSAIRRKAAEHLTHSWIAPHVTNHDLADVTGLEELRQRFASRAATHGVKLTLTAIALKIVSEALKAFPQFKPSVDMARSEIDPWAMIDGSKGYGGSASPAKSLLRPGRIVAFGEAHRVPVGWPLVDSGPRRTDVDRVRGDHSMRQASSNSRRGDRGWSFRGSPWPRLTRKLDFTLPSGRKAASTWA